MKFQDYPTSDDPNFHDKIFCKREFYELVCEQINLWKDGREYLKTLVSNELKAMPHQKFVQRFMSPATPYKGLLKFWNTGVGKTWGAIGICEANKEFVHTNGSKITILTPNDLIRNVFINEILGERKDKSNDFRYIKGATGDSYIDQELRDQLNAMSDSKQRKKIRKYVLRHRVSKYYDLTTHERWYAEVLQLTDEQIANRFQNAVIVVDEVQQSKNVKSNMYSALKKVVQYGSNNKIILLSATPMVDSPDDICQPLNLLRMNDGCTDLLEPQTIRNYFSKQSHVREAAKRDIIAKTTGYISYMRGLNPYTFPKRIDKGESIFRNLNYPIIRCAMKHDQLREYVRTFMREFAANPDLGYSNDLWNHSRDVSRCHYPSSIFANASSRLRLSLENVDRFSCKFKTIWSYATSPSGITKGPVLIYAFNIDKGVNRFEKFLQGCGVPEYSRGTSRRNCYFNFGKCADQNLINHVVAISRKKNTPIRWLLCSAKVRFGVTFSYISQIHILEPDWNIASTEQLIGRGIRHLSHVSVDELAPGANVGECEVYRYRASLPANLMEQLDKNLCVQFRCFLNYHFSNLEAKGFIGPECELLSIDEYMYKISLIKDHRIRQIERLIKENAVDSMVNVYSNYFDFESVEYFGTRISDYQMTEYKLHGKRDIRSLSFLPNDAIDCSTIDLCDYRDMSMNVAAVQSIFDKTRIATLDQIGGEKQYEILNKLLDKKTVFKSSKFGDGFLIYRDSFYIFVPYIQTNCSDGYGLQDVPMYHHGNLLKMVHSKYLSMDGERWVEPWIKKPTSVFDFFPIKNIIPNVRFPDKFNGDTFELNDNGIIKVRPGKICGVIYNTKDHIYVYDLKICRNNRKKNACKTILVDELMNICNELGIETKRPKTRQKIRLERLITARLFQNCSMLPWITREQPSLFWLLLLATQWELTDVIVAIRKIEAKLFEKHLDIFAQLISDLVAEKGYYDGYKMEETKQELLDARTNSSHFLLQLVALMNASKRPTRFKAVKEWEIVQNASEKLNEFIGKEYNQIVRTVVDQVRLRTSSSENKF